MSDNDPPVCGTKVIRVHYEIPPFRGIYWAEFQDDGQSDAEVQRTFLLRNPSARIRKIGRRLFYGE